MRSGFCLETRVQLWVGIGNPGAQYALHRHNVGFMAADTIAEVHAFGAVQKKFSGWLQEGRIGGARVLLLKPATFMNESGRAVSEALRFYKLEPDALTVFHDELDLAPFKVKVKQGGGTAGHNGLSRSTSTSAPISAGCGSVSGIRGIRTVSLAMCWAIIPKRRWTRWRMCWVRFRPRRNGWPRVTTCAS